MKRCIAHEGVFCLLGACYLLVIADPTAAIVTSSSIADATWPASCSNCHGLAANPAPDGAQYPDTAGSHPVHAARFNLECVLCHNTPEGPGGPGHFDFVEPADVVLSVTHPLIGAEAIYDATARTCASIYCHGPWAGHRGTVHPVWSDPSSVYCGSCHGVLATAPEDVSGDGYIAWQDLAAYALIWQNPAATAGKREGHDREALASAEGLLAIHARWHQSASGEDLSPSHAIHFDKVRGPGLSGCDTCHPSNLESHSSIDGVVVFVDGKGLGDTEVCNHCHAVTAQTKPDWNGSVACMDCHSPAQPANSMADGSGVSAPGIEDAFFTAGHGLAASETFAVSGNRGPGFEDCLACHAQEPESGRHISHVAGDADRLRRVAGDSHPFTTTVSEFCLDCHLPGKDGPGSLGHDARAEGNIHSSAITGHYSTLLSAPLAFPAYGNESDYSADPGYQCDVCHDPHGTSNLSMINATIDGRLGGVSNPQPVRLTTAAPEWARGSDGVCEACHVTGGEPHPDTREPGNHNLAQDCRECHDNHAASFQPSGGASCIDCHSQPQGERRAVTEEFALRSHHVIDAISDARCIVCHDQREHMGGAVRLKNPDQASAAIVYTDGPSLEPFCLACHDANGADGDTAPFADGGAPADIETTWLGSAHEGADLTCADCHDNGHGSRKKKLLAPADTAPVFPALTEEEEGFCFGCHAANETEFALASHHDIAYVDQQAGGSRIECANCHNPHVSTRDEPRIDPDNAAQLWTGDPDNFCLRCHDGNAPEGILFPNASAGTGYDKSRWTTGLHKATGQIACDNCHLPHGSSQLSLKALRYDQADAVDYVHGSDQYALCWQCHDEDKVVRSASGVNARNAFGSRHDKHVRGEDSACIECHDPHFSYDAGEDGLISFAYPVKHHWNFSLNGQNLSSAFRDTGTNLGECYLSCHGEGHNPEDYSGTTVSTLK